MKAVINKYSIVIAILLVVFNLITFIAPGWAGAEKYTGSFWVGYIVITLAFIINFAVTYVSLKKSDSKQKLFYNIPIVYICYCSLIACTFVGVLCMFNSNMPIWIAIIAAAIAIGINIIAVLKAKVTIDIVEAIDTQVSEKTSFIRDLTAQAKTLTSIANSPEAKEACNKVYEALRYSDPVSSDAVSNVEQEIAQKFGTFTDAVKTNDEALIQRCTTELMAVIVSRNDLCKRNKR